MQRNDYDLILMYVCMFVIDGLQTIQLICKYELSGNWDAVEEALVNLSTFVQSISDLVECHIIAISMALSVQRKEMHLCVVCGRPQGEKSSHLQGVDW